MRPLRLEIEGFTCFKEKQAIDFRDLNLFAIAGPTGSGKSTLLDAMVFALYGYVPRIGKAGLKELIALGRDRLAVTFEFRVGQATYRVARISRRTGATQAVLDEVSADSERSVAEGVKEVDEEIERLLGLGYQAFIQAVVLPQGDFQRFLKSSPNDRRKILAEILRVQVYERMRQQAVEMSKRAGSGVQHLEERLGQDFAGVTDEAIDIKRSEIKKLAASTKQLKASLVERRKALNELRERHRKSNECEKAKAHRSALHEQLPSINAARRVLENARRAEPLIPILDAAAESQKRATDLAQQAETANQRRAGAEAAENNARVKLLATEESAKQIPDLKKTLAKLQEAKAQLKPLADAQAALTSAEKRRQALDDEIKASDKPEAKAHENVDRLRKAAAAAAEAVRKSPHDSKRYRELSGLGEAAARLGHIRTTLAEATHDNSNAQEELLVKEAEIEKAIKVEEVAKARLEGAKERLRSAEAAWHKSEGDRAVAAVRAELKVGEPCPVCEQGVHRLPEKVKLSNDDALVSLREKAMKAVTEAQTKLTEQAHARTQAEAFAKSQKTVASKARAKVERLQGELKSTEDALSVKVKGLLGDAPGKTLEARVGAAIKVADRLRDSHDNLEKTAREAREKAADAASELEKLKTARAGRIAKLEAETRQIAEKRADIDQLRKRLTQLVSTDDVVGELERTGLQIGKLEDDHKNAEKDHGKAVAVREKADVIFQEMSKQSRQSRARADSDAKALRADLKRAEFDDEAAARAAIVTSSEQKRIERRISVFEGDLLATENTIAALDEALGGNLVAEAAFLEEQSAVELQEEQYERSSRAEEALRTELKEMEARHDTAKELATRLDTNRKRFDIYRRLSQELGGSQFQAFVVRETLRELAGGASARLMSLSSSRYELSLLDDTFHVIDHDNARERRSAETLSGGETFLASLALALELSNQVQRAFGATVLDSLFLDEGFGTLDPEALEVATAAIEALPTGGRMVGIITHIQELTNRLPAKLMVERRADGSRVTLAA